MNPLMAVRVEPGPPSVSALLPPTGSQLEGGAADQGFGPPGEPAAEALRSLVSRYDTVVACGLPLREVAALDDLCRQLGKQLFAGEVRGASSFAFVDLGPRHTYTVKVLRRSGGATTGVRKHHRGLPSTCRGTSKSVAWEYLHCHTSLYRVCY
ncbi:hypothetical protein Vretifemale_10201 [Volvox reticuliferus]|uniref:Uncharacterized protein n=1 Tax=Volvox reticuliferus TaxID=1737510 RepID=A0A8J4CEU8_9CHLO|nr:hypothetical protein Vretifemale_10201 [Volvox reticuliferus]